MSLGRWQINEMRMGLGWNASMGGPITEAFPMPVVPCDDAAIERATTALLEDSGLPVWGPYRETIERRVRLALGAAGETP